MEWCLSATQPPDECIHLYTSVRQVIMWRCMMRTIIFIFVSLFVSVFVLYLNIWVRISYLWIFFPLVVLTYSRSLIVMFQAKWKQHPNLRVRLYLWEDVRPSWLGRPPRGFRLQLQRGFHLPPSHWSLSVSRVEISNQHQSPISINNQHHHLTGVFLWELQLHCLW